MKGPNLEHSDVVFMYYPKDIGTYEAYGATMGAWGGAHSQAQVAAAHAAGVHSTGTMWCLTAGPRELHNDPDLLDATVRDIQGNRIAVPWLPDQVHEGTPAWWGCGNHPSFRAHLRKTVCDAMKGGADGLHIDDHLSTAHPAAYEGGCFCDHCMALFTEHLVAHGTPDMASACGLDGVSPFVGFDYRDVVRRYASTREECRRLRASIPIHDEYVDFQLGRAAENARQLGHLAEEIVGHPITLSANTGLPDLSHTVVTPYLTHLVGEVHHDAPAGTTNLMGAVRAYRMAEALGKPIAATASGHDWDFALGHKSEKLICLWVALSYACGQRLMAPVHMWCFNPTVGTRWYDGPTEVFAPLYRFVRANRHLFDGQGTVGPLGVPAGYGVAHKRALSALSGRLALKADLEAGDPRPASAQGDQYVWVFPRERDSSNGASAAIHVLNLHYDATDDSFAPQRDVLVRLPPGTLRGRYAKATAHSFDAPPVELSLEAVGAEDAFAIRLPELRLWTVIELRES